MKHLRGFTLIELMIVIAVIGILAAIALPAFTEQIRKSRRTEALQVLSHLQLQEERWRASHSTYGTSDAPPAGVGLPTSDSYAFVITAGSLSGTDVEITATPQGPQTGDRCGTYTLRIDNNNDNDPAGTLDKTTSTGASRCW